MSDVSFDPIFLVAIMGSIVTTIGGFFAMWSIIRTSRRDSKLDLDASNAALERRLKDHINGKLDIMDTKLDGVKDEVKKNDISYRRELDGFAKWIDRIERNVASNIQRVTGSRRFYKSATQPEQETEE